MPSDSLLENRLNLLKLTENYRKHLEDTDGYGSYGFSPELGLSNFRNSVKDLSKLQSSVVYIGGSHLEFATVKNLNLGKPQFSKIKNLEIGGIKCQEEFLNLICENTPKDLDLLILNFAAQIKNVLNPVTNKRDAVLVGDHRLHNFSWLKNKFVCEFLSEEIRKKTGRKIQIVAFNNLVSLALLSGDDRPTKEVGKIFGIFATGVNLGYRDFSGEIINLEAGKWNFKGKQVSEIAGLKGIFSSYNRQADKKGWHKLYSIKSLKKLLETSSAQSDYAKKLVQNSAEIIASQILALYKYKFQNTRVQKLEFVVEGSLFWQIRLFQEFLYSILKEFLGVEFEKFVFILKNNAFLLGPTRIFNLKKIRCKHKLPKTFFLKTSIFRNAFSILAPPITA